MSWLEYYSPIKTNPANSYAEICLARSDIHSYYFKRCIICDTKTKYYHRYIYIVKKCGACRGRKYKTFSGIFNFPNQIVPEEGWIY
jgi:hypothetical protein